MILSVDLGTTNLKIAFFDSHGDISEKRSAPLNIQASIKSELIIAEQKPNEWIETLIYLLKNLNDRSKKEVEAIAITGQSTSVVLADEKGLPLLNAILHMDSRSEEYFNYIKNIIGRVPSFPEVKLFGLLYWVKDRQPEIFYRVRKVFDARQYILYKLSQEHMYDSYAFNHNTLRRVSSDLDLEPDIFGRPHDFFTPAGYLSKDVALETGLPPELPIFVGPWDGMCDIIGSGLSREDEFMDVAGTTEIMAMIFSNRNSLVTHEYIIPGRWIVYRSFPLGVSHRWLAERFFSLQGGVLTDDAYTFMDQLAARAKDSEVFFYPYFFGAYLKPYLRGLILGLTYELGLPEVIKSLYLTSAFIVRSVLEEISEATSAEVARIIGGGGGYRSRLWAQIKADVLERPIHILQVLDTALLGAAILAYTNLGYYKNLAEAQSQMIKVKDVVFPNLDAEKKYQRLYLKFKEFSGKIESLLEAIYYE
ncbi:xylulokinase [Infirmifilum sp.]|jgi:xylulokinase|uniref:xylulokinase n=1 Tax=Infirmifilum sp. TaxID=2856575 RepID=UPI003D0A85B7